MFETLAQMEKRLGVSRQYLLRMCAEKRIIGAKKIGCYWIVPEGENVIPKRNKEPKKNTKSV